ncbi:hypothetical protein, partial [Mesorhizobium sp.]|uniref:hypothetical protein n=1 Tax=Mesorhizobium sp. TaxID=1871066 RepID=UPI0025B901D0
MRAVAPMPAPAQNSGFDNFCRLDIICIRMKLTGFGCRKDPYFGEARRDPLRETHHHRRGVRFAWRG